MRPYSELSRSSCSAAPTVRMRANTSKPSNVQPRLEAINAFHCVQSSDLYHREAPPALNSLIPHSLPVAVLHGSAGAKPITTRRTRPMLWHDGKEQKHRENGEVYDALKHSGPSRAQRDDADEKGQRQQGLVFLVQPKRDRLVQRDRNHSYRRNCKADAGKRRTQGQV